MPSTCFLNANTDMPTPEKPEPDGIPAAGEPSPATALGRMKLHWD